MPLRNLSNFWRTLEIPLMNCEISLNLTWSKKCVMSFAVGKTEFGILDTKPPFVTLSTEENSKLLKQLESGFKRKNNWNIIIILIMIIIPKIIILFLRKEMYLISQ